MKMSKRPCACKDCVAAAEKKERFLNHPFYKEVDEFCEEVKQQQILKGAEKYDEPFTPDSWTNDELADHGMQENRDQAVYITGMRDRMRKQEAEINKLKKENSELWAKLTALQIENNKLKGANK
jgi:hypothetical protein